MTRLTRLPNACFFVFLLTACGPSSSTRDGGDSQADAATAPCTNGVQRCTGSEFQECVGGTWVVQETCTDECHPSLGCVLCIPGTGMCNGDTSTACDVDGMGISDVFCDPVQGMTCDSGSGLCAGACAPAELQASYVGCEYYATVTAQAVSNHFPFAITVGNASAAIATVTIDGGGLGAPVAFDVAPGDVGVRELPWVTDLKNCTLANPGGACGGILPFVARIVTGGAYRVRSNQPVNVYQFSPKDYTLAGTFSYSNDASLLLPTNAMTGNYIAASYPAWAGQNWPGLLSVTATQDSTSVTINPRATSTGTPSFPAGQDTTVMLNRGDVVQLLNTAGDLTGSRVTADRPVQVIGGHFCTNIPASISACDHIEETQLPLEALGTTYLISAPAVPSILTGKERVIRIVATAANTTISYQPALALPTTIANVGDFIQIERQTGDYLIEADQKILVAEYMEGQGAGGGTGDPAMTSAVPIDQYRTNYLFHAPINYEVNYINVTAPTGAQIMLDQAPVTGFQPIGASAYSVARFALANGTNGNHTITGDQPFGITIYGYGQYTSYWYPGGLDLTNIPVQ